ncbi:acyl-CoA reductase-like NAD-dependent aldehyde dehydrogenase [Litorimonas taeanensis]|uniref:Acyl-CoA reductase-like NAD-dependent aldehyde dehydrogenase n=1 Tax=Litorimonas taeanensis TaxID=568099 RepID=A0A420WM22_9PROT|nr:aldehyde dehydrogenase family protein [Litorimonas taeanensis]RKQ71935.1 acyl-CoA reductase-like NAD-dependent aldehyde dehydrogenase [Litorimonas taeanensis]
MTKTLQVKNPRTGIADYEISPVGEDQIASIAKRSRASQLQWRAQGLEVRGAAMLKLADAMEAEASAIQQALSIDTGRKRMAQMEVLGVIANIRAWVDRAPKLMPNSEWIQGRAKPNFKHKNDYVPYALVGVISPWNFPMTLSFIDAIPALLAGACVIVKPSEVTPRFADAVMSAIPKAGMENILTFIQGDGRTGAALIDYVDSVCFTGSVPTGKKVAVKAAENLIPANLELGGKDPLIITADADLEAATTLALRSSVLATGQACQSIERVYVPRSIYSDFTQKLAIKAKETRLNFPDIDDGHIGPFIFDKQAQIVSAQIDDAKAKGARVLSGGEILRHGGGYWLEPTVIIDVTHDMDVMRSETFGPVIPVMAYDSIEQAIELANDTEYGLSGGVFAGSIDEAKQIGDYIDAGAISIMDAALTGQYFEAGKQSFKHSGLGPSRMGENGFLRFFRQKAYIANTISPLTMEDFKE